MENNISFSKKRISSLLKVSNNNSLVNVTVLTNVSSVGGDLEVPENPHLVDIPLTNLTTLEGSLTFLKNTSLTSIYFPLLVFVPGSFFSSE